jgi:mannan endo-1,4-beta-mannosidase
MNRARFVAALIAAVGVTITVTGAGSALWLYRHQPVPRHTHAPAALLPPASSAPFPQSAIGNPGPMHYVGVFEHDTVSSYRPVTLFTSVAGRKPNLTVYYSGWNMPFRARIATAAARAGAVVLVHMEPWHQSMAAIAAGDSDRYLRRFAAAVRRYGGHVIISFAPEADGRWYPWGWHHAAPARWVAAWRHVVTVFRQADATNVTWLWVMSGDNRVIGQLRDWWPGAHYVDWIGVDGYYFTRASTFKTVIGNTVRGIRKFTHKPVLLSEVGIGPRAGQAAKIPGLFAGIRRNHLLGLVYFDVNQHQGLYHQDWRLDDNPAAVAAFRAGVRSAQLSRAKRRGA